MQAGIFNYLFIFAIAALNDYVIVASIIVIAIRNSINCAALGEQITNKFTYQTYMCFILWRISDMFLSESGLRISGKEGMTKPACSKFSLNHYNYQCTY